jgi:CDP-diacylglycerol--glycerol-3-phosphate 3-phosphatidyltransferase
MLSDILARPFQWIAERMASGLAATGIHADVLTWLALFLNLWAGVLFAAGRFFAAGLFMIAAGIFNLVDGPVARRQGRSGGFGGFLGSILGCYADLVLFLGLLVYYARVNRFLYAVVVGVAMAGAVLVSYAQARAESLAESGRVGFWERPERLVLMILGALTNRMPLALWVLAIGPNITVVHRIIHTWRQTEGRLRAAQPAEEEPAPSEVPKAAVLSRSAGHGG